MDEPQRLTVASTWKFDVDGVDEIKQRLKTYPKTGPCKYEPAYDVFTIDGHNSGVFKSAEALTRVLATFIEDEKDNDLLEKPKVTRIVAPTAVDVEQDEHDVDVEAGGALIDDILHPPQATTLPLVIKYWPDDGDCVDCFAKFPYVLAKLSEVTKATVVLEKERKKIRISSSHLAQVDEAMDYLSNLEKSLSLVTSPQVANILNVGNAKHFRLRLIVYKALNEVALSRVLADPQSRIAGQLHRMFTTSIGFLDPNSHVYNVAENIQKPARMKERRKGGSNLWADYKLQSLGDSANLPDLTKAVNPAKEATQHDQKVQSGNAQEDIPVQRPGHPYLSAEKASIVNNWVKRVDSDPGSEPNNTLPPEPVAEVAEPPKGIAGLKKRRVVAIGGNDAAAEPKPLAFPNGGSIENQKDRKEVTEPPVATTGANPNAGANGVQKASLIKTSGEDLPVTSPSHPKTPSRLDLIDLSDTSPAATPASNMPLMFSQEPLVPRRIQASSSFENTPAEVLTNGHFPVRNRTIPPGINGHSIKTMREKMPGPNGTAINAVQGVEKADDKLCDDQSAPPVRLLEREHKESEVGSRRFHRTMRQKAPNPHSMKGTKAIEKAKKQAALTNAWGPVPSPAVSGISKPSAAPEPSLWKKEKLAAAEKINVDMMKEIFAPLEPVLEAARCFPGTLSLQVQLGMILVHSVPQEYLDRMFNEKVWNGLFRPRHCVLPPSTSFVNRLTTSGADIDYLVGLTAENDGAAPKIFSEEPSTRSVHYEFHCQTKSDEQIVICVDETGGMVVNQPEALIGSVNVHCPRNIWDMSVVVKGTHKYPTGFSEEVDCAVRTLNESLIVLPNGGHIQILFRIPPGNELTVAKVMMRRSTTHHYIPGNHRANDFTSHAENGQGSTLGSRANGASNTTRPTSPEICLEITEVQNLYLGTTDADKTLIRARSLGPPKMVDDSRLWYEASVVSPGIERILRSNKDLELGTCTSTWCPADVLGDGGSGSGGSASQTGTNSASEVGAAGLGQLYRIANCVVEKIDVIGWSNAGPGIDLPESIANGSAVARSNFLAANSHGMAGTAAGRFSNLRAAQNVDSVSARDAVTGPMNESEFW